VFVNAFTSKEYYISKLELTVLRFYVVDFPPKKVAGKLFCFALFNSFLRVSACMKMQRHFDFCLSLLACHRAELLVDECELSQTVQGVVCTNV